MKDEPSPSNVDELSEACRWISNMGGVLNENGNDLHRLSRRVREAKTDGERRRLISAELGAIRETSRLAADLAECLASVVGDEEALTTTR